MSDFDRTLVADLTAKVVGLTRDRDAVLSELVAERQSADVLRDALRQVQRERDAVVGLLRGLAEVCDTIDGRTRNTRLLAYEQVVKAWWRANRPPGTPEAWKTQEERAAELDPEGGEG